MHCKDQKVFVKHVTILLHFKIIMANHSWRSITLPLSHKVGLIIRKTLLLYALTATVEPRNLKIAMNTTIICEKKYLLLKITWIANKVWTK